MHHLENKVIVILNADTEIGAVIASRFLLEGAYVVLNGIKELLPDLTKGADWSHYLWHEGDATNEAYLEKMLKDVKSRFTHIDAVVNVIQPVVAGYFLSNTAEQWHRVSKAGIDGVFLATRLAVPHLLQTSGSLTNVLLRFDNGRDVGGSAYFSTREAIVKFTQSVARELASEGVRLNVVSPRITSISTLGVDIEDKTSLINAVAEKIPVGRSAIPEEIASVVAFLASLDASFVNGIDLAVDGGFSGVGR